MSDTIEVEYKGETLAYQEYSGKWTARGGDLTADQLNELKKKIDALRKKEWKPISAMHAYGREMRLVTVTSDAETVGYRKVPEFWISIDDGRKKSRRKVSKASLYADSDHNREVIKRINAMEHEANALNKKCGEAMKELQPFVVPTTEART